MPTTRRSTGGARARTGPAKGQSTISFAGKVTKSVPKDVKASIAAPAAAKIDVPERTKPKEEVEHPQPEEEEVVESVEPEKTEAEVQAEKLSDTQINKYWKAIEKERKAPRVHQQGLSVHEKVLRYFDVSSQYGPCIGIDRLRRWQRAERLGLKPPIEVLAVLLRDENKANKEMHTAHMDGILNSIAIGA